MNRTLFQLLAATIGQSLFLINGIAAAGWTKADFLAGVAEAKKQFRSTAIHSTFTVTNSTKSAPSNTSVESYDVVIYGKFNKERLTNSRGRVVELVSNPSYAFKVNMDTPRTLGWLESFAGGKSEALAQIAKERQQIDFYLFSDWCPWGKYLWEWPADPGFSISDVTNEDRDGHACCRINYSYTHTIQDNKQHTYKGYFVCDPGRNWSLREFGTIGSDGVPRGIVRNTFADSNGVLLSSNTDVFAKDGKTIAAEIKTEYATFEPVREIDEREFYLKHYGFDEPVFTRSRSAWFWYSVVGGAGCLTAAYFARKRIRDAKDGQ